MVKSEVDSKRSISKGASSINRFDCTMLCIVNVGSSRLGCSSTAIGLGLVISRVPLTVHRGRSANVKAEHCVHEFQRLAYCHG
jgi:hypothetical protein